jgi:hypothetical protein
VQSFAEDALKKGASGRANLAFHGEDVGAEEMICGGDAEVLIEFIDTGAPILKEIFERIYAIIRDRKQG